MLEISKHTDRDPPL